MKYDEHDIKKLDFIIDCVLETDLPIYSNCFDKSELTLGETKDDKEFIGIVTKYEVKEDKITIEIKAKEKLLITYKYQDKEFNNSSTNFLFT
jgi:hypothetical protein